MDKKFLKFWSQKHRVSSPWDLMACSLWFIETLPGEQSIKSFGIGILLEHFYIHCIILAFPYILFFRHTFFLYIFLDFINNVSYCQHYFQKCDPCEFWLCLGVLDPWGSTDAGKSNPLKCFWLLFNIKKGPYWCRPRQWSLSPSRCNPDADNFWPGSWMYVRCAVRNVGPAGRLPYALKKVNNHFLALSVGHYSCSLLLSHPVSFFLFILSILVVCPKMEPRPSFPKSIPRRPLYPQDDSRFGFPPW